MFAHPLRVGVSAGSALLVLLLLGACATDDGLAPSTPDGFDATRGDLDITFRTPSQAAVPGLQSLQRGGRRFSVYVPSSYTEERSWPVALLLHGSDDRGATIVNALAAHAEQAGVVLIAPDAARYTWDLILGNVGPDAAYIEQLLDWGVVPVVNENDTLATDELRFGDNDTLSALVAVAIGADELVLLTDADRLYSGDPRTDAEARPIEEVRNLAELDSLHNVATGGGQWGTGGMTTKLAAARIATSSGIRVRLADGRDPAVLDALLAGERVGTVFQPSPTPLPDRKGWLAHALLPKGSLHLDAGAEQALTRQGASLLAVGVKAVEGDFGRREAVRLLASDGRELGRGLATLSSTELRELMGRAGVEVVHRDQLVLTSS
jgi:glutamate 5-kinase